MQQDRLWDRLQAGGDLTAKAFGGALGRHRFLANQVEPGRAVLNIGVGNGSLERELSERGCIVHTLDPSTAAVKLVRDQLDLGGRARVGRSEDIPFDTDGFDVVIMSEVLEHLDDDVLRRTIHEVRRVLRPTGHFLGTVPANEDIPKNWCVCPGCGHEFHRYGHVQSFSELRLQSTLSTAFEFAEIRRRYFADSANLNWRGRVAGVAKKGLMRVGVTGTNETFVFEAHGGERSSND